MTAEGLKYTGPRHIEEGGNVMVGGIILSIVIAMYVGAVIDLEDVVSR